MKTKTGLKSHKTPLGFLNSVEVRNKINNMSYDELRETFDQVVPKIVKKTIRGEDYTSIDINTSAMIAEELAYRTTIKHKHIKTTKEQDALNRICILAAKAFADACSHGVSQTHVILRSIMEEAALGGSTIDDPKDYGMPCGTALWESCSKIKSNEKG